MSQPTQNLVRMNLAPVELRADGGTGDGNTLVGHFAVFNRWTEINSWYEGRFLERISPKAFSRTFKERAGQFRVLYDHGHDPSIGNKPLGTPDVLRADDTGAYYEVGLFDAPYVNDLKPAIRAGQMGASFRFSVVKETIVEPKQASDHNPGKLPERTIDDVDLYEFGPVTFPAYAEATSGIRSTTDEFLERLLADPKFLARFMDRVGPKHAAEVLTSAAGSAPALSHADSATSGPGAASSGRLIHAARSTLITLRR